MNSKINEKQELMNQEMYKKIIQKLVEIRKKKTIPQRVLSKILGKKQRFINEVENGKEELDLVTFINICNALGIISNNILSEFITNDLENCSFDKLDTNTQKIIKNLVDAIANNSQDKIQNQIEAQHFSSDIMAQRLSDFRKDRKIGSRELSDKLNFAHGYISNIEKGVTNINLATFVDICNVLECTPNDLLQPFIKNYNFNDYNNLKPENKYLVDTLIRICNKEQSEVGYLSKRKMTPEELEAFNKKLDSRKKKL